MEASRRGPQLLCDSTYRQRPEEAHPETVGKVLVARDWAVDELGMGRDVANRYRVLWWGRGRETF